jgi:hypothetical protein
MIAIDILLPSVSGRSILDKSPDETDTSIFQAPEWVRKKAECKLEALGFKITASSNYGISILGEQELVDQVFGEDEIQVPENLQDCIVAVRLLPEGEWYSG